METKSSNPKNSGKSNIPQIALNIQIGDFLECEGTIAQLIEQVKTKMKQKDVNKLDKIIMKLLLNANLKNENFDDPLFTNLIVELIGYVLEGRKKKINPDIEEIYNTISIYFSEDPLLKILFERSVDLSKNEEVEIYLDILIPFILHKKIDLLINSLKIYFNKDVIKLIGTLFEDLDNKSTKTFEFLKQLLLKIIKLKENIIDEINNFVNDYFNQEKNEFLQCKICADFPILILEQNKKISMRYSCSHNQENIINSNENSKF